MKQEKPTTPYILIHNQLHEKSINDGIDTKMSCSLTTADKLVGNMEVTITPILSLNVSKNNKDNKKIN